MEKIKGDLTEFPNGINVAFQNCNIHNVMGAGIAKAFREKFPRVFEVDQEFYIEPGMKRLGKYTWAYVGGEKNVINLYGQTLGVENPFNLGAYTEALQNSLDEFFEEDGAFEDIDYEPVLGFPWMIGAGLAKGHFPAIKEVTEWFVDKTGLDAYWVDIVGYKK